MCAKIKSIFDGSIGYFFPMDEEASYVESEPQRGYIQLDQNGRLYVETLDENPMQTLAGGENQVAGPVAISGVTKDASVLMLDATNDGYSTNMGGYRASINKYSSRVAVFDVDPEQIGSFKLNRVDALFAGIDRWIGYRATEEESETDDEGRLQSYTIRVRNAADSSAVIDDGGSRSVVMSAYWSVGGPSDRREVYAPISMGCESEEPKRYWELLYPVIRMQDLVSLAFDGLVVSDGGTARLIYGAEIHRKDFWASPLMTAPDGAMLRKSRTQIPSFGLSDIGGVDGIARWVKLSYEHERAVKAVVNRYRIGRGSPELELMEIAAGMEYWRNSKVRTPGAEWADEKCPPKALAAQAGDPFAEWVGYPKKWVDDFWESYNKLKHEASFSPDVHTIRVLATVGHRLLTSSLLAEVGDSRLTQERYLASPQHANYGQTVREFLSRG